jgi:hypothetical protein
MVGATPRNGQGHCRSKTIRWVELSIEDDWHLPRSRESSMIECVGYSSGPGYAETINSLSLSCMTISHHFPLRADNDVEPRQ